MTRPRRSSSPSPDSFTFIQSDPETLDAILTNYDITGVLGRGGMGAVSRARQKRLNRDVAIKILPAHVGRELQFAERFEREAQSMASLQHPNIVSVYDFGDATLEDGTELLYFVMEFVEGTDLHRLTFSP